MLYDRVVWVISHTGRLLGVDVWYIMVILYCVLICQGKDECIASYSKPDGTHPVMVFRLTAYGAGEKASSYSGRVS